MFMYMWIDKTYVLRITRGMRASHFSRRCHVAVFIEAPIPRRLGGDETPAVPVMPLAQGSLVLEARSPDGWI